MSVVTQTSYARGSDTYVIVARTFPEATRIAVQSGLTEDEWVWAATDAIAEQWLADAAARQVRLERPGRGGRPGLGVAA